MRTRRRLARVAALVLAAAAIPAETALPSPQYGQRTRRPYSLRHVKPAGGPESTAPRSYYKEDGTLKGLKPPVHLPVKRIPLDEVPDSPPPAPPVPACESVEPKGPPAGQAPRRGDVTADAAPPDSPSTTGTDVTAILVIGFGLVTIGTLLYRRSRR